MISNKSAAGFSLIELMVTVAIISILSTIAIPNFQAFTFKARQAEARSALGAMYTTEKAFQAEYQFYTSCLWQAGYQPPDGGLRHYATGFWSPTYVGTYDSGGSTCMTSGGVAWGGYARDDASFMQNVWANPNLYHQDVSPMNYGVTNSTFTACAFGSISAAYPNYDVWSIDESNTITNVQAGF